MNFLFWNKKSGEKPEPRRFEVPADKVKELRRLNDVYWSKNIQVDKVAHYELWLFVVEMFPSVSADGQWRTSFPTALRAEIVEIMEISEVGHLQDLKL
jgi:hypothetical protein